MALPIPDFSQVVLDTRGMSPYDQEDKAKLYFVQSVCFSDLTDYVDEESSTYVRDYVFDYGNDFYRFYLDRLESIGWVKRVQKADLDWHSDYEEDEDALQSEIDNLGRGYKLVVRYDKL